jgi:beta-glucanase (GH16 family)
MSRSAAISAHRWSKSEIALGSGLVAVTLAVVTLGASNPAGAATASWVDRFATYNSGRWQIASGWSNGDYLVNNWLASQVAFGPDGLVFTLNKNASSPSGYASGEIRTKTTFQYGYFEAKMQAAAGAGLDTGFFTYTGKSFGAPTNNEVDVEVLGQNTHAVSLTYHNGAQQVSTSVKLPFDASAAPHLYAFDWQPKYIRWYIDNKLVLTQTGASLALPMEPQFLFFNLWGSNSLGSWMGLFSWPGRPITAGVACSAFTPSYADQTYC